MPFPHTRAHTAHIKTNEPDNDSITYTLLYYYIWLLHTHVWNALILNVRWVHQFAIGSVILTEIVSRRLSQFGNVYIRINKYNLRASDDKAVGRGQRVVCGARLDAAAQCGGRNTTCFHDHGHARFHFRTTLPHRHRSKFRIAHSFLNVSNESWKLLQ